VDNLLGSMHDSKVFGNPRKSAYTVEIDKSLVKGHCETEPANDTEKRETFSLKGKESDDISFNEQPIESEHV
jgi:hypothetical protein